jgi:hypothetical protein
MQVNPSFPGEDRARVHQPCEVQSWQGQLRDPGHHLEQFAGDMDRRVINATLYDKLGYNFIRDIAPVAGIIRYPLVM